MAKITISQLQNILKEKGYELIDDTPEMQQPQAQPANIPTGQPSLYEQQREDNFKNIAAERERYAQSAKQTQSMIDFNALNDKKRMDDYNKTMLDWQNQRTSEAEAVMNRKIMEEMTYGKSNPIRKVEREGMPTEYTNIPERRSLLAMPDIPPSQNAIETPNRPTLFPEGRPSFAPQEKEKPSLLSPTATVPPTKTPDDIYISKLVALKKQAKQDKIEEGITGVKKDKTPIQFQSDKIQLTMAELGINPNDKTSYTPENMAKVAAKIREVDTQDKKDKNELLTAGQKAMIGHQLRTEMRQDKYIQDFKDIDNKFKVMEAAYKKAQGGDAKTFVAIDQALITLYNKMTDPTSVVRESEYARTPENMSIVNRILGKMDKWKQGGAGLTPTEREALVIMGKEFYNQYSMNYDQIVSDYEQTAKDSGIDANLVGTPYRRKKATINQQTAQQSQGNPEIIVTKSGRKAKRNSQGQLEYTD